MQMCAIFDALENTYTRVVPKKQSPQNYPDIDPNTPYIRVHLNYWYKSSIVGINRVRTGGNHNVMSFDTNENRRVLPSTIRNAIKRLSSDYKLGSRVPMTWIAMYLHNIRPDTNKNNWEFYECSHLCIEFYERSAVPRIHACVDPLCLVWESKSVNQSRGNTFCTRMCVHECHQIVCVCQNFHVPHCK